MLAGAPPDAGADDPEEGGLLPILVNFMLKILDALCGLQDSTDFPLQKGDQGLAVPHLFDIPCPRGFNIRLRRGIFTVSLLWRIHIKAIPMPAFFSRKQYAFRLLLNEGRAFQRLIKTGQGETQLWEWIDDLVRHSSPRMELPLKQKLLKASLDHDLAPALMLAAAGRAFPVIVRVPASWRLFLRAKGTKIHLLSAVLWRAEILRKFMDGIRVYKRLNKNTQPAPGVPYAVLMGLHGGTYTSVLRNKNAKDFFAWFRDCFPLSHYWIVPASVENYTSIRDCTWVPAAFPALPTKTQSEFQITARKIIVTAFAQLCTGRWHNAYMLVDRLEEIYMGLVPAADLAQMYAFTNANYIYRPLWTYEVERRGAEVSLFFYAINSFNIALASGRGNGTAPGYSLMSWPHIYTQHENHKKFLQSTMSQQANIHVVGLIPYEDNAADIHLPDTINILYLDVQPFRKAFMASIGRPCHFYTQEVARESFEDIVSVTTDMQVRLFIKPKRDVGKRLPSGYREMLTEAEQKKHVTVIDSYISPLRLCAKVDIVICQPFTTAALFAESAGKPVVYYDAQGLFIKDQPACQGVPLLKGRAELADWLSERLLEIQSKSRKN